LEAKVSTSSSSSLSASGSATPNRAPGSATSGAAAIAASAFTPKLPNNNSDTPMILPGGGSIAMTPRTRQGIETLIAQKVAEAIAPVAAAAADSAAVSTAAAAAVAAVVVPSASPVGTSRRKVASTATVNGTKTPSSSTGAARSKTRRVPATEVRSKNTSARSSNGNSATIAAIRSPSHAVGSSSSSSSSLRGMTMTGAAVRAAAVYEWEHDVQRRRVRDRVAAILDDPITDDERDTPRTPNNHTSNGYHSYRNAAVRHTQGGVSNTDGIISRASSTTNGMQHTNYQASAATADELELDGQLSWRAPLYVAGEERHDGDEEAEERAVAARARAQRDAEREQQQANGIVSPHDVWQHEYGTNNNNNERVRRNEAAMIINDEHQLADIKHQLESTLLNASTTNDVVTNSKSLKAQSSTSAFQSTNIPISYATASLISPEASSSTSKSLLQFYNTSQTRAPRSLVRSAARSRTAHMTPSNATSGDINGAVAANHRLAVPVGNDASVIRSLSYTTSAPTLGGLLVARPTSTIPVAASSNGVHVNPPLISNHAWLDRDNDNGHSAATRIQERTATSIVSSIASRQRSSSASRHTTRSATTNRYPLASAPNAPTSNSGAAATSVRNSGGNTSLRNIDNISNIDDIMSSPLMSLSSSSSLHDASDTISMDDASISNASNISSRYGHHSNGMSGTSPFVGLDLDRLLRVATPSQPTLGRARPLHATVASSSNKGGTKARTVRAASVGRR
jgi:hypothetical protein